MAGIGTVKVLQLDKNVFPRMVSADRVKILTLRTSFLHGLKERLLQPAELGVFFTRGLKVIPNFEGGNPYHRYELTRLGTEDLTKMIKGWEEKPSQDEVTFALKLIEGTLPENTDAGWFENKLPEALATKSSARDIDAVFGDKLLNVTMQSIISRKIGDALPKEVI